MPLSSILTCPKCGMRFSLTYSRTFACKGCDQVTFGKCGHAKCPKCGEEFAC